MKCESKDLESSLDLPVNSRKHWEGLLGSPSLSFCKGNTSGGLGDPYGAHDEKLSVLRILGYADPDRRRGSIFVLNNYCCRKPWCFLPGMARQVA